MFSDFGGFGFSVFSIILFFVGLSLLWKRKYKNFSIYLILLILIVLSFFSDLGIYLLNFFVAIFASIGFLKLLRKKWEITLFKNLTILILILGLIFSGLSFINRMSSMEPSQDAIFCLEFLKINTNKNSVVFSHYSRGNWITAIANRKNVIDSNFFYAPRLGDRFDDSKKIFDINEDFSLLDSYGVDYIYLDSSLKKEIWDDEEKGLLFALKYSKKFKKLFGNGYCEVWEYGG